MNIKKTRRGFLKTLFGGVLAAVGLGTGGYFYAREIEPRLLDIQSHDILHSLIPVTLDGFRIVQFSDTHIGFHYSLGQLKTLTEKINELKPDLIVFNGDLIDDPNSFEDTDEIVNILKKLEAPAGKFAVYGNHDHGGYGTELYQTLMDRSGFSVLFNNGTTITKSGGSFYLAGIDDKMLGKPNLSKAFENTPKDIYKILLSHAPDVADEAATYGCHFQLSGHSHGGQIKIPLFGALVVPPYAEKYYEGFYSLDGTERLTVYVNRGLGTTRLPFRFLSKPELTVFTLKNKA
ncbi:metallophosphoesterase [Bacillus sp. FJAT-27225]|uniref:metallophosphoesterase n=1 Tax=Bacillus sp. FJAT-27225 TaxID=1743144 RepID=UPI00080C2F23|nr:metallophosphoesterase [Bacillus sp. FJAT-27225]OCA85612.1 metallophosphoesterase [Bacillus sp. FJAT-27225]